MNIQISRHYRFTITFLVTNYNMR